MATKIRVELAKRDLSVAVGSGVGKKPGVYLGSARGSRTISRRTGEGMRTLHMNRVIFDEKGRALEYCEQ